MSQQDLMKLTKAELVALYTGKQAKQAKKPTTRREAIAAWKAEKGITPAKTEAYKARYASEWAKWQALGKHTSEENQAYHKFLVAHLRKEASK